jgi:hypothetical protein
MKMGAPKMAIMLGKLGDKPEEDEETEDSSGEGDKVQAAAEDFADSMGLKGEQRTTAIDKFVAAVNDCMMEE